MAKSYPLEPAAADKIRVIMGLRDKAKAELLVTDIWSRLDWLNNAIVQEAEAAGHAQEGLPDVPMSFDQQNMCFVDPAGDDGEEEASENGES
jgi:hypothetical protein